jgi:hypothetical protein
MNPNPFGCGGQKNKALLRVVLRSGFVRTVFEARINRARSMGTAEYHAAGGKKSMRMKTIGLAIAKPLPVTRVDFPGRASYLMRKA